jgi:hypothetical protein
MKQMFELLGETLSDVSSDERYNDAKIRKKLEANTKKLSQLAHDIKDSKLPKPDADPSLTIFAQLFANEADRAYHALKNGHGDYARDLIRSIPGYCISCHTRNNAGNPSASLPMPEPLKQLKTLERASSSLVHPSSSAWASSARTASRVVSETPLISSPACTSAHAMARLCACASSASIARPTCSSPCVAESRATLPSPLPTACWSGAWS